MSFNTKIAENKIKKLPENLLEVLKEFKRTKVTEEELIYRLSLIMKNTTQTDEELLNSLIKYLQYYTLLDMENIKNVIRTIGTLLAETSDRLINASGYITDNYNIIGSNIAKNILDIKILKSEIDTAKLLTNSNNSWLSMLNDFSSSSSFNQNIGSNTLCIDYNKNVITLPIIKDVILNNSIENVEITTGSNGDSGNSKIPNAAINNNINAILDIDKTTIFEYESFSTDPLIMNLKITLKSPAILNKIDITKLTYPTTDDTKIIDIKTSLDGDNYKSVMTDTKTPIEMSTSLNNSSNNIIYIYPSNCKYIIISFVQNSSYPIKDRYGNIKLRKAIAIKDIALHSIRYAKSGSLQLSDFIIKYPVEQLAYDINCSFCNYATITIDSKLNNDNDKYTTTPISEQENLPKILHINDPGDSDSIEIDGLVNTVTPFINITRKEMNKNIVNETVLENELIDFPTEAPYEISLSKQTSKERLVLSSPSYIGVGKNRKAFIADATGEGEQLYNIPIDINKDSKINIYVDDVLYEETNDIEAIPSNSKLYSINREAGKIIFSTAFSANVPELNQEITMSIDEETPNASISGSSVIIETNNTPSEYIQSDDDKIELYNIDGIKEIEEICIFNGKTSELSERPIINDSTQITLEGFSYVKYINGISEFTTNSQFSVDVNSKKIYISTNTTASLQAKYKTYNKIYIPIIEKKNNKLIVDKSNVMVFKKGSFAVSLANGMVVLENNNIIENTTKIYTTGTDNCVITEDSEVPFINGIDEFNLYEKIVDQIPKGKKEIILSFIPTEDKDIIFSDTIIFSHRIDDNTIPIRNGQYSITIDKIRNRAIIKTYSDTRGGSIRYYIKKKNINQNSMFSVDRKNGVIYFPNKFVNTMATISYNYYNIKVRYVMSRVIDKESYSFVDGSTSIRFVKLDSINDIKKWQMPLLASYYPISNLGNTNLLDAYMSPVIKGVQIRWI